MAILKSDIIKVNGIIIGYENIKELDKRLEILTDDFGRIRVYAFSARSQKSQNIAKTRLLSTGKFEITKSKNNYSLVYVDVKNYYDELIYDYDLFMIATRMINLIKQFTYENMDCKNELALICYALNALNNTNIENDLVEKLFEIKLTELSGVYESPETIASKFLTNVKRINNLIKLLEYVYSLPPANLFSFKLDGDLYDDLMRVKFDFKNLI